MSQNQVAILLYAFMALAIVSKLGGGPGGIEQIAYAQTWDFSGVVSHNTNNNIQINRNVLQPNDNNNINAGTSSNCIAISSGLIRGVNNMSLSSGLSSSWKTPSNCVHSGFHNPCQKLIVKNEIKFRVPPAEVTRYNNVIKAVSEPPIQTRFQPVTNPNETTTPSPVQEICGTNHDDYIIGSEGEDIIFGLQGNDIIMALGGDDLVFAGPGDDFVYGGDGNNQLFGEDGNDNLIGGTGDDLIVGGNGNDRLYGNSGDDILQGGPGADYFDCGDGVDTVVDYTPTQGDVVSINCENVNLVH